MKASSTLLLRLRLHAMAGVALMPHDVAHRPIKGPGALGER